MDIKISVDNIDCKIESALTPSVTTLIYEELKCRAEGYEHVWSFINKRWDGYNRLFNPSTTIFRRGLLPRVVQILTENGYNPIVTINLKHTPHIDHKFNAHLIKSYEFQQNLLPVVEAKDMGIIVSPTGSGKSLMCALMINTLKKYAMVLVTDLVLLDQMQQNLARLFDQPIGVIGDGEFDLQPITVTTLQSFASITDAKSIEAADKRKLLLRHVNMVGVVISDEAHLYDSNTVGKIMPYFTATEKFFGMSATPYGWAEKAEKKFNLELEQHFGEVIYDCRKVDFISLGVKAPLIVSIINRQPLRTEYKEHFKRGFRGVLSPDNAKNFKHCLDVEILDNPLYHAEIAKLALDLMNGGRTVFVYAPHKLAFSQAIHDLIPGSVLINGKTKRLARRTAYDNMRTKKVLCIVSDLGSTGLDIPSLDALIVAGDVTDIRQLKGRVERAAPGKVNGLLIDLNTDVSFLAKHHSIRRSQYKHDGNIVLG